MAIYDLTTTIEGAKTITNLVTARTATFTNMDAPIKGVFTFKAGDLALTQATMETPVYGHKYYGRCYQKAPAGHTWNDARFEYYAEDVAGTGLMVFGTMEPTNDEWKILSSIQELTGEPTGSTWNLRSFVSGGNTDSYRKEIIIIDLTATYGTGNEPSKEWCDKNIPFFEGSLTILPDLQEGDVINCPYSGAKKGVMLPIGKYTLETWGAAGGSYANSMSTGGEGGYTVATLSKNKPVGLILYAGGAGTFGSSSTYTVVSGGGFNGGGNAGYRGGAGGGGSDIRIGYDSLYARALVAGGGGGAYAYSTTYKAAGGNGGGPQGEIGGYYSSSYTTYRGNPGTLIAGGASGSAVTSGNYDGKAGTFGAGGATGYKYNSSSYYSSGAGGGGWYGGGAADHYNGSYSRTRYASGGGGGSGYYWSAGSAEFYPDGCLLSEEDYLENAYFRQGGNRSAGKCKITVLNLGNLDDAIHIGSTEMKQIELGNSLIEKIYLGENQLVPKLPKFLEYVEADGKQYIDTGFYPSSNTTLELCIEITNLNGNSYNGDWIPMFGSRDTTTSPCINTFASFHSAATNTNVSFPYGKTDNYPITLSSSLLAKNVIRIEGNKYYFNGALSFTSTDTTAFTAAQSLVLLSIKEISGGVDARRVWGKIYYMKIWDNNVLVRDYKPALDNQNRPCLYDLVEQKYYYSMGTRDLLAPSYDILQVTRAILDTGTFQNVTPTYLTNQQNASDGFTITGTVGNSNQLFADQLRWDYTLNMTDYDKLTFYCKKGADHGTCRVFIDGEIIFGQIHYNDLPTSWTLYTVDLSSWKGEHTISFAGGYNDSTGNTSSATSYCDIKFLKATAASS